MGKTLKDFHQQLGPPQTTVVEPKVVARYTTPMFQEREGDVRYHTKEETELPGFVTERMYLRPESNGSVKSITFLYLHVH